MPKVTRLAGTADSKAGLLLFIFFKFYLFFYYFYFWLHWVLVAVHRLLIAVAYLVAEHSLRSWGTWTELFHSMRNLPEPGDQPHLPRTGRQIPIPCTVTEVLKLSFLKVLSSPLGVMKTFWNWIEVVSVQKAMAPHSSTLAWKIPWTEEPGGLQSMGSLRVGSDTTERLHFHFSLSCIGEGNGSPLQCSCLENPRDGGAWWAAV